MALFEPDYKLEQASNIIENLSDSPKNELIKYYISSREKVIKEQRAQIKEHMDWFNKLNSFLPKTNRIYG